MKKTIFNDYQTAVDWIKEGRSGWDRPVANNTRLHLGDGIVGLKLHQTNVVSLYENGDVGFDSGGWRTMTTADRMRYHPDYTIQSVGGIWFIYNRAQRKAAERRLRRKFGLPEMWVDGPEDWRWESEHLGSLGPRSAGHGFWAEVAEHIGRKEAYAIYREFNRQLKHKAMYLFFDGIRFTARGKCLNALPAEEEDKKVSASNALRRRIRLFAKEAVAHLHEGHVLGEPHWINEVTEIDYRYCEQLMEERRFPDRLFFDAMAESNYVDVGQMWHLGYSDDNEFGRPMIGGTTRASYDGQPRDRASLDIVANEVYKFVCRRMLPDRETRSGFGGMSPSALEGIK